MEGDYQPIREKNSVAVGNLIDLDGGPVQNDLADSKGGIRSSFYRQLCACCFISDF